MLQTTSKWSTQKFFLEDTRRRNCWELLLPLLMSMALLLLRYILEKFVFIQIFRWYGLSEVKCQAFSRAKKLTSAEILGLAKQTDTSPEQVRQQLNERNTLLEKFNEAAWKFCCYTSSSVGGILVLWDKPWLWDIRMCWVNYPNQFLPNDIWWYFMLSLSFWWSQLFILPFEVRRKGRHIMYVHHIIAVVVMIVCWIMQGFRIMSLGLLVSDSCEVFFKGFKLAKYLGYRKLVDVGFVMFVLVWFISRFGLFLFWIVRSLTIHVPELAPTIATHPFYCVVLVIVYTLCVLNVFWTYYLLKMISRLVHFGHVGNDSRSDNEEE